MEDFFEVDRDTYITVKNTDKLSIKILNGNFAGEHVESVKESFDEKVKDLQEQINHKKLPIRICYQDG